MFNYTKKTIKTSTGSFGDSFDKVFEKMSEAFDSMGEAIDKVFTDITEKDEMEISSNNISVSVINGKVDLKGDVKEIIINGTKIYPKGS